MNAGALLGLVRSLPLLIYSAVRLAPSVFALFDHVLTVTEMHAQNLVRLTGGGRSVASSARPSEPEMNPQGLSHPPGTRIKPTIGYEPPFGMAKLSIDSDGEVKVTVGASIVTPLGTWSIDWERQAIRYLELTLGSTTKFYPLEARPFRLDLPAQLYTDCSIKYDGEGNIRLMCSEEAALRFPGQ